MNNNELIKRDLSVLWHPCTQMKDHEWLPLIPIKRGKGVWLEDYDGNRYLDAISSWWVNLFGHSNPKINAAIQQQSKQLEHVLLAGFSHEPAVKLAEELVKILPEPLERCFFTDNGSSAVEAALKMSYHYWRNLGQNGKTKFIALTNSYHGETLGALAVGGVDLYKKTYHPLLMDVLTVQSPDCFYREPGESNRDYSIRMFEPMRRKLEKYHKEVCAVIIEPLVQCAGNMRMYDSIYLWLLRQACNEFGVHLIADEIATGFGRTGSMFACEQADISPDIMCLSKGLTGGYLPLAVVATTDRLYRAFYDDYETLKAFLHSHSYTGNALACSAAIATLAIFKEKNVIKNNKSLEKCMLDAVLPIVDHPHVAEIRQQGMIIAIEMVKNKATKESFPWQQRRGLHVYQYGLKNEMLLRPLGNVVYFMPPYVIKPQEIRQMADVAIKGIDLATKN
ncbi:MAG: adenosylmethionine--8-amino-7-oxononanoate transaminase [Gammaproteobacteria bacterium]|nr:adenosylmethionine--8-amino-7-oxononanoate transaminase [Gammaproteobacteria bacterium]